MMDTLKRLTRQSGSSQSATADDLAELIEKKLYSIMDCARDYADNLTECSLKPGPKGDKGCLGDQGKEGPQGMNGDIGHNGSNGEPGVQGDIGLNGFPGRRGEVGPMGPIGDLGPMGPRGDKGDMGEIGPRGDTGIKGMTGVPGPPAPPSETCGGLGWRKVVHLDMTDTSQNCPQGLTLTGYSKRSCGRTNTNERSCSSVTFPVWWSIQSSVWES